MRIKPTEDDEFPARGSPSVAAASTGGPETYINFGRRWSESFAAVILKRNAGALLAAGLKHATDIKQLPTSTVPLRVERVQQVQRRLRKIMIVAVARKLAIAFWRYVELGLVPQGAILNPPMTGNAR